MGVQIDSPAEVGLRVHKAGSSQCRLLPVDVSNNGAAVLVTVGKANAPPPYRIENRWASPGPFSIRLPWQHGTLHGSWSYWAGCWIMSGIPVLRHKLSGRTGCKEAMRRAVHAGTLCCCH